MNRSSIPLFSSIKDIVRQGRERFGNILTGMRRQKPASQSSGRRRNIRSKRVGRNFRSTDYEKGVTPIALYQTIRNAMMKQGSISEGIEKANILGWERMEKESMTLIFLIDVSNSTYPYISIFTDVLKTSVKHFTKNRDRIGLISLQGAQARIINYPTHNYRIIIKGLKNLTVHGETPLGDGLGKAITMAKTEKYKNPDANPMIVMLSDCYPEPVTNQYDDMLDEPIYRDAMNKSEHIKKTDVKFLLIKPMHYKEEENNMPGIRLAEEIVRRSGGRMMKLNPVHTFTGAGNSYSQIPRAKMRDIMTSIEDTFLQKRQGPDSI
ncbi:MAG: VWA domain-containing protein [candidate division WOR-3 bacterium]|nr:VWA domain-containing protein [candidate division WOR-3 bacterium]